ncbi:hypothetical protein L1887_22502 [Cichorium endivia]|nr:hypothetical protein L1887_22502 [Cichorium endivia]
MGDHDRNARIHSPVAEVAVVMVSFIAHGHLNQLLHLSHLLSTYNIPVHFINTTTHIRQVRSRFFDSLSAATNLIHFHELATPPFTSPPLTIPTSFLPTYNPPSIQLAIQSPTSHSLSLAPTGESLSSMTLRYPSPLSKPSANLGEIEQTRPVDPGMLKRLTSTDGSLLREFKEFVKHHQFAKGVPRVGGRAGIGGAEVGTAIRYYGTLCNG